MSGNTSETRQAETTSSGDRRWGFDCCGSGMGDVMARCPCGVFMRRRPVVTSLFLAATGLAALLIPTGAILGIIAFFRTT